MGDLSNEDIVCSKKHEISKWSVNICDKLL